VSPRGPRGYAGDPVHSAEDSSRRALVAVGAGVGDVVGDRGELAGVHAEAGDPGVQGGGDRHRGSSACADGLRRLHDLRPLGPGRRGGLGASRRRAGPSPGASAEG
jgi:hypothetical protein